ncbi:MAG: seg [Candidatus Wolfebacteria bacterium GW2011_GWC1_43_10]|uniref:Seg n=2 Tax=Candidatus Wolfeibacteriota TaxID=1752735 RepID=A0A0G1F342_9BACT|nr:MAG: seg [Candidatus Wolfebacteria bacterium GW2011_GWC1_43_10]KKT22883.1 MAG: hypothetical protein UW08_C0002G0012 [Parcubacteria group bacterium GW2011_GWB1_43_8b]OGM89831.1 MAG: hypothetical protein A2108_02805 [Candidatus Wolfebacteria bacterium GWA1_42_9]
MKRLRVGPLGKKILILLGTGLALSLTQRPDRYFQIIKLARREWEKINYQALCRAIRSLYQSKLIGYQENEDGTVKLVLSDSGKHRTLQYDLDKIKIKKPAKWDNLWRMVIFDIPERFKQGRDALVDKFKQLGFCPLQKSVFIYPYDCKNEIDFLVEVFELRPYVRFILVKETDVDLDLKHRFNLR